MPWGSNLLLAILNDMCLFSYIQVVSLIGAHSDVFVAVLKDQQPGVSMAMLRELSLVTAVISHAGYGRLICYCAYFT